MSQSTQSPASRTIESISEDLASLRTGILEYVSVLKDSSILVNAADHSVGYACGGTIYDGRLVLSSPQSRCMSRAAYELPDTPEVRTLIAEMQAVAANTIAPVTQTMPVKLANLYQQAGSRPNGFASLKGSTAAVGISRWGNTDQIAIEYYTEAGMDDDTLSLGNGEMLAARDDYRIHSVTIILDAAPDFSKLVESGKVADALRRANLI